MIIYKGYYHFRKHDGRVINCEFNSGHRGSISLLSRTNAPRQIILLLNKKDSIEERVLTVIHEFAHLGLEYEEILFPSQEQVKARREIAPHQYKTEEERIERLAREFYTEIFSKPTLSSQLSKFLSQKVSNKTQGLFDNINPPLIEYVRKLIIES